MKMVYLPATHATINNIIILGGLDLTVVVDTESLEVLSSSALLTANADKG